MSLWPGRDAARVEFVLVAETGALERQALLACESLRRFGGRHADGAVTVVSPRPDRRPGAASLARFAGLGCTYLPLDLTSSEPEYGPSYRMLACAHVERESRADVLVAMDSDLLVAREPDLALRGRGAALRPVDVKGICTSGAGDPRDRYWRDLCDFAGLDHDALPLVRTTVGGIRVKASYNGGLAAVRRDLGIFQRTLALFESSVAAGLVPTPGAVHRFPAAHGTVQGRAAELWGSSQSCLAVAAWQTGRGVRILPRSHNVPLHLFDELSFLERPLRMSIVHYHHLMEAEPLTFRRLLRPGRVSREFAMWLHTVMQE